MLLGAWLCANAVPFRNNLAFFSELTQDFSCLHTSVAGWATSCPLLWCPHAWWCITLLEHFSHTVCTLGSANLPLCLWHTTCLHHCLSRLSDVCPQRSEKVSVWTGPSSTAFRPKQDLKREDRKKRQRLDSELVRAGAEPPTEATQKLDRSTLADTNKLYASMNACCLCFVQLRTHYTEPRYTLMMFDSQLRLSRQ